ncbi:hypothetical protein G6F50_015913 [Rhizopus delemar]|uniref:Uncharacterized protein n=1 Tax=Rhizopus delemar TaxID=936053 RepID=A0A9P7C2T4_9FUNG|nr:hypothetical protein G6F50_015913 [Rhizopus delemar]
MHTRRRAVGVQPEAEQHDAQPAGDHRDDGAHLQQRQPELQFAEHLDRTQVDRADEAHDRQHPDPAWGVRVPEAHVETEHGDVGQAHHQPRERVAPAGQETQVGAQIARGVVPERPRNRRPDGHFA